VRVLLRPAAPGPLAPGACVRPESSPAGVPDERSRDVLPAQRHPEAQDTAWAQGRGRGLPLSLPFKRTRAVWQGCGGHAAGSGACLWPAKEDHGLELTAEWAGARSPRCRLRERGAARSRASRPRRGPARCRNAAGLSTPPARVPRMRVRLSPLRAGASEADESRWARPSRGSRNRADRKALQVRAFGREPGHLSRHAACNGIRQKERNPTQAEETLSMGWLRTPPEVQRRAHVIHRESMNLI